MGLQVIASHETAPGVRESARGPLKTSLRAEAEQAVTTLVAALQREAAPEYRATVAAIADLVLRPAKRLRPYLCLLAYAAGGGADGEVRQGVGTFAASLELLHAFLLIHDDIADRAEIRRGGPSLHVLLQPANTLIPREERRRIGEQLAVVAGDWLYTRAVQGMLEAPGLDPSRRSRAALSVLDICSSTAEGQASDIAFTTRSFPEVTPAQILELYRRKTGRYTFEAPLVAGALLAGASESACEALRLCSHQLGVAFQLQDDLLSLFESEQETGKPALADLVEGKKTWLLLQARERMEVRDRLWLDLLTNRRHATEGDLARVRELIRATGTIRLADEEVWCRCVAARKALEVPEVAPWRESLEPIISWIEGRSGAGAREAA
jgi:geranylgeranyl diphosphate synthase type I